MFILIVDMLTALINKLRTKIQLQVMERSCKPKQDE